MYLSLERGDGREKESERNINVWLPLTCPLLGTWSVTQACALTGNLTRDSGSQAGSQSTGPHQPGHHAFIYYFSCFFFLFSFSCFYFLVFHFLLLNRFFIFPFFMLLPPVGRSFSPDTHPHFQQTHLPHAK